MTSLDFLLAPALLVWPRSLFIRISIHVSELTESGSKCGQIVEFEIAVVRTYAKSRTLPRLPLALFKRHCYFRHKSLLDKEHYRISQTSLRLEGRQFRDFRVLWCKGRIFVSVRLHLPLNKEIYLYHDSSISGQGIQENQREFLCALPNYKHRQYHLYPAQKSTTS